MAGRRERVSAKGYGGSDKNGGRLRLQISSVGGRERVEIGARAAADPHSEPACGRRANGMRIKICKEERERERSDWKE